MRSHFILAALVAAAALGFALLAGQHRRAALVGASSASITAITSLFAMGRLSRTARKPMQSALLVVTVMFLVRLLLVAGGTVYVARTGGDILTFVIAFFVPYFAFAAIEGAFAHSLGHAKGAAT